MYCVAVQVQCEVCVIVLKLAIRKVIEISQHNLCIPVDHVLPILDYQAISNMQIIHVHVNLLVIKLKFIYTIIVPIIVNLLQDTGSCLPVVLISTELTTSTVVEGKMPCKC